MEYTFDNTAYRITADNYQILNHIYNTYWKPNGIKLKKSKDIAELYERNQADIVNKNYSLTYTKSWLDSEKFLYLSETDDLRNDGFQIRVLNNLINIE